MKVPQQAIEIVKKWEGFSPTAYFDPIGVLTVGYGTTSRAGVGLTVVPGLTLTEKEAEAYLRKALEKFAFDIRPVIEAPMNENEWAAFLSLAYNIGPGAFARSTALKRFNAGDKEGAAEAILWFNKAGGQFMRGLANRRAEEVELFLKPVPPKKYSLRRILGIRRFDKPVEKRSVWAIIAAFFRRLFKGD